MGSVCESKNGNLQDFNKKQKKNYLSDNYDLEEQASKFNNFIFEDNIQDFLESKYNLNDPIFKLIRADEKNILEKFYRANKNDLQNNMSSFLQDQNINFITMLTKQIISYEGGREIFQQKIKDEIQEIYNNEDDSKINYLTVMIIGKTGVGKSCLVNNILFGGKEVAKEGIRKRVTQVRKTYNNKKVPYIRLVDTVGIELSDKFSVDAVGFDAKKFIEEQFAQDDINNYVHCIWYCVDSTRFEGEEIKLVSKLIEAVGSTKIPLIIVLTQASDIERAESMKREIKKLNFEDVIDIIAKKTKLQNGTYLDSINLDKLILLTLKKCKAALNMDMKIAMVRNLKNRIKQSLFAENKNIKQKIKFKMMQNAIKNDIANQNFDNYINNIYSYYVVYFLNNNELSSKSSSLIKKGDFNRHKNNFFSHCQEYENNLISKHLPIFANQFLDLQATTEKRKKKNLDINNRRNYVDFINTTSKFLIDNFNAFASKFYVFFVNTNIIDKLSTDFEKEFNNIVEQLMSNREIENALIGCFMKKFSDFEKRAYQYPPFDKNFVDYNLPNFTFDDINNEKNNKDLWMDNFNLIIEKNN